MLRLIVRPVLLLVFLLGAAGIQAQEGTTHRVIIGLNTAYTLETQLDPASTQAQRAGIQAAQQSVLASLANATVLSSHQYTVIPFMALEVDDRGLALLEANPAVTSIIADQPRNLHATPADNHNAVVGAPGAWAAGYDGAGVAVAVLDSGLEANHPAFAGRVVEEACFTSDNARTDTTCPNGTGEQTGPGASLPTMDSPSNHGQHVSGTTMGNDGQDGGFRGVAPGASLISINVFSEVTTSGAVTAWDSDIIQALEWIYTLRDDYNVASVNMSLGSGQYFDEATCDAALPNYVAIAGQLNSVGIAVVSSSGNDADGDSSYKQSIGSPACVSNIVSVGSTEVEMAGFSNLQTDTVSDFSNSASFLDLLAPGQVIYSTVFNDGYGYKQGTSMASPQVAGAWAVLEQAFPNATPEEILTAFKDTGVYITDPVSGLSHPRIQLDTALAIDPGTPTLVSPVAALLGDETPTLTWESLPYAVSYTVAVMQESSEVFSAMVDDCLDESCSVTVENPLPPGNYTWSVTAANPLGAEGNTANSNFEISDAIPVANNDAYTGTYDVMLEISAPGVLENDTTTEGTLTAELVSPPENGTLNLSSDGGFTYMPDDGYVGTATFEYRVFNGMFESQVATVSITIPNPPPVANDDSYNTKTNTPLEVVAPGVLSNDTDQNGDNLTVTLDATTTNGILTLNADGSFTYTPATDYEGADSFTYTVDDGENSASATVNLTVGNSVPVAADDAYSTPYDTPITIAAPGVLSNDTDQDNEPLTVSLMSEPANGVLTLNTDGSFTYTPAADYVGPDSFTYTASDGFDNSTPATVTITVQPRPANSLYLAGGLENAPVRPVFGWVPPESNGNPQLDQWYGLTVQDMNGETVLQQWAEAGTVCTGRTCEMTVTAEMLVAGFSNGSYRWTVQGWSNGNTRAIGQQEQFSISMPTTPQPTFNVEISTGRPVLTFNNNPAIGWVQVYIGTPDFSETVHMGWYDKSTLACDETACTLPPNANPLNGSYVVYMQAWGAAGYNDNNASSWVGPENFTLSLPAAEPIAPLTTTDDGSTFTVTWESGANTTWYQLWIGTDAPDFETVFNQWFPAAELGCAGTQAGATCTAILTDLNMTNGEAHVWYVKSWGPGGEAPDWQEGTTFTP